MISRLDNRQVDRLYRHFTDQLTQTGFQGDIALGYADRVVLATDNSIYQLLPQGVVYPRSTNDISLLLKLAAQADFRAIVLAPRGGGTSTNGQSLTNGLMIDTSRYLTHILEINAEQRWARVQAGVVKDQLNASAAPHGLFFAPELATSNRATVGGMVNTDASGQGSVVYGKTHDHVLALTSVLADGTVWQSTPVDDATLATLCQRHDKVGDIHRIVRAIDERYKARIAAVFPPLHRSLTGYDLAHIRRADGQFDLNALLCGSEGTLAIITEIKVKLLPLPSTTALVLVFYDSFQAALQDAQTLIAAKPDAIETIDANILALAKADPIWSTVQAFFPDPSDGVMGVNLVEFSGDNNAQLDASIQRLHTACQQHSRAARQGYRVITDRTAIERLWHMRKQAVGLLGNMTGEARPIPFIEDVAVPPAQLAPFITQFRALLDSHQLCYGMFGHVDAGVLHVRPAIDMKDPQQAALVRTLSDQVATLAQAHGGVFWGEHGKGMRSEYAPAFFADLYPILQQIKQVFDPHNQLNPGKIATPVAMPATLFKIDAVPTRGQQDRMIAQQALAAFASGMYCNGNGACFNYHPNSILCPTWKATQDRIQSPKGRANLVREWLRLQTLAGTSIADAIATVSQPLSVIKTVIQSLQKIGYGWQRWRHPQDFSHAVYQALDQCMGCKACAGQCPVQVNVPDLRSRYFALYHAKYARPLRHWLAARLESVLPWLAKGKCAYNGVVQSTIGRRFLATITGLTDLPTITSTHPTRDACRAGALLADQSTLASFSKAQRRRAVILVQDAFTGFFETSLLTDLIKLLIKLGYQPLLAPFQPNGKVLHVYGYLNQFTQVAHRHSLTLQTLAATQVPLVGIDAAVTLTYRDEYRSVLGQQVPKVWLLSDWFASQLTTIRRLKLGLRGHFTLLGHCTETTNAPTAIQQWQQLYAACGLTLTYQPTGCCGMAGIYGHETNYQAIARRLYNLSWRAIVQNPDYAGKLVATGYSCRSQIKRYGDGAIPHPVQMLLRLLSMSVRTNNVL